MYLSASYTRPHTRPHIVPVVSVVRVFCIDTVPTYCSRYQAFVILQGLAAPYNKYITQINRLNVVKSFVWVIALVIPINHFSFANTLEVIHSCNNHFASPFTQTSNLHFQLLPLLQALQYTQTLL